MIAVPSSRPRFVEPVPVPASVLLERARSRLRCPEPRIHVQMAYHHLELLIDPADRHTWSPWLSVSIDPDPARPDGALIRGRWGPHPAVWTGFVSLQIVWAFAALCGAVYGLTALTLGHAAWSLWLVPGAAALMGLTHTAAWVGQQLGRAQMGTLQAALADLLAERSPCELMDAVPPRPDSPAGVAATAPPAPAPAGP
jgi:hypothetical protein